MIIITGSAATTEKKIPYFYQTFPNLKFHFFQTPTVATNTPKSQTMLNRPRGVARGVLRVVWRAMWPWNGQEDQLVLFLPNKLPGSALDWLSRAKQPSALDVLGGEKRRIRKRTDKGFSLSKKCYFLRSPTFSRTWLGPESSTPVENPLCVIDKAVTDRQRLFNFERSHSVLTPAPSRDASDSRRRDRKFTGSALHVIWHASIANKQSGWVRLRRTSAVRTRIARGTLREPRRRFLQRKEKKKTKQGKRELVVPFRQSQRDNENSSGQKAITFSRKWLREAGRAGRAGTASCKRPATAKTLHSRTSSV